MATIDCNLLNTIMTEPASSLTNTSNEQVSSNTKKPPIVPLLDLSKELQFSMRKKKLIRNKLCGQIYSKYQNFADLDDDSPLELIHSPNSVSSRKSSSERKKSIIESKKVPENLAGRKKFHRKPCDKHPVGKGELNKEEKVTCVCLII
ncbi:hypothetical protein SteCoe_10514 [Stentor coeruleus]|uniref:Uncharacterized protein n=1 Tax=Stentor coeruleus TaxID=5963 RepID=A0A1R2CFG5_9CILI|nr:hypothetical protein SteCoe_10514 [Stentor coeruleus]